MYYKNIELPDNLTDKAQRYVINLIDELDNQRKISTLDAGQFYILAESYNTYLLAVDIMDAEGLIVSNSAGVPIPHPALKIAKENKTTCLRICDSMGFSLRSRKSLEAVEAEVDESPLETFMKNQIEN